MPRTAEIGDGTFGAPVNPQCLAALCNGGFAVGDVDGDGIPDLIKQQANTSDLLIRYGKGDGTFSPAQTFAMNVDGSPNRLIDLNGDGRPDLVLTTTTGIAVLLNTH